MWNEWWSLWKNDRRNLWSVIVVLSGLFIGSLFVDIGELVTGSGFSGPAIQSHDVLVTGGKTWVGYSEPKVELQIINDATCAQCDPSEALLWLRRIVPTIEAERIDVASLEGQRLVTAFRLMTVPAFIFGPTVKQTEFYTQAEPLFREENGDFVFDMHKIGMPIGRYLNAPETGANDIILGAPTAPVTLLIFSDFQCQYCQEYHTNYKRLLTEYEGQIRIVWKHFPLASHAQAVTAAEASQCAAAQNQFLPYADVLFERRNEWGKEGGERRFRDYAWRVKGLDAPAFVRCLETGVFVEKVTADKKRAEDFGIESVPATFVNREFISGAAPYADLKALVDAALAP